MTDENNKLRALVLTALMVFSVFAGTVALSGAAAANLSSISANSADDVDANTDGQTQAVSFDVTVSANEQHTISVNYSELSNVDVTAVSASSGNPEVSVTDTQTNNGNAEITVKDETGNGVHTATISATMTVDTGAKEKDVSLTIADKGGSASDSVTFTVGALASSSDYDKEITPNVRTWSGQTLYRAGFTDNDQGVELQRQTSSGWQFVTVVDVNSFGEAFLTGTSGYETGTYRLTDTSADSGETFPGDNETVKFKISPQDYSASADPTTVKNDGEGTNTDITVESNRGSYDHWISSPDVDPSTIQSLLGGAGTLADVDGDGENDYVAVSGTTTDTLTANFTGVSAGNYTIDFLVPDTGVTSSVDLTVEAAQTGNAQFVTKAISEQRGDVVAINVSLTGTANSANVQVGGPSVNYNEVVQVTDENDDGYVTFYWNSYHAGTGSDTFEAAGDDSVSRVSGSTSFSEGALAGGEYPVNVTVNGQETDVATVVLNSPTDVSNSIQTWTAPSTASESSTAPNYLFNEISEDSSIAKGDYVVVEMQTAGVFGQLGAPPASGQDGFSAFANGANFSIVQTADSTPTNTQRKSIDTSTSDTQAVFSPSGNTIYVYLDTGDFNKFEVNSNTPTEVYAATLSYQEAFSTYRTSDASTSTTFSIVSRTANVDAPQDDAENPLTVTQSDAAEVSGTSSLAAGSNLTVTARSSGGQNPFLRTATATVQEDGTWSTTLDVADIPTGTNFTVSVKDGSQTKDTVNARIGGAANIQLASLDAPETAAPGSTITVTATVENTGDSSGETEVAYMFNGTTESTQNVSVDAGSTTQVTFEYTVPSATGDYTHGVMVGDNAAVTAGITVQDETSTTTEPTDETTTEPTDEPTTTEPTDEPTTSEAPETSEPTTTEDSSGQPGFGVAVALVALVAAALLATRRDN
ncbi:BGTF surface domain-containing protein [Halorubellus litoreus]|uniref:BGTF surface domain-containing protein n=1 Tax=Halorubellus litoreus TaxID=755308 RepID=A0ABD5VBG6_9EURY